MVVVLSVVRACVRGRRQSSQQSQAGKFVGLWKLCDSAEGLPMLPRRLTWKIHVIDFHDLSKTLRYVLD